GHRRPGLKRQKQRNDLRDVTYLTRRHQEGSESCFEEDLVKLLYSGVSLAGRLPCSFLHSRFIPLGTCKRQGPLALCSLRDLQGHGHVCAAPTVSGKTTEFILRICRYLCIYEDD
ncbi:hypothetical protein AVEN_32506-1, partial [Araneus ventricosus]